MSIRVLLVDDHGVVRSGLSRLIRDQPDIEVVGEAKDAAAAVDLAERLQPDIVVLDIGLPGESGLQAIPKIQRACSGCRILMLTMYAGPAYLREAIERGARGYVVKEYAFEELISAIHTIHNGDTYYKAPFEQPPVPLPVPEADPQAVDGISERELQVLVLVAWGYTSRQIADRINLSIKTIEGYRSRGMDKIGARSRADVVRWASTHGWLDPTRPLPGAAGEAVAGEEGLKRA
ncbi:MAG: DNA-binding response regulator [Acidobacteria bacterium]|nr:MAG: DNA-binding response regulator [Acidobacteriota bacterium]